MTFVAWLIVFLMLCSMVHFCMFKVDWNGSIVRGAMAFLSVIVWLAWMAYAWFHFDVWNRLA